MNMKSLFFPQKSPNLALGNRGEGLLSKDPLKHNNNKKDNIRIFKKFSKMRGEMQG